MVLLLEQLNDFTFAELELLQLHEGSGMVRKERELGGLVPEQVDVTSIDVVLEPLLGDSKLLSDVRDGEIPLWPTRMGVEAL